MKKIIKKFWGIALIVTLLASMIVSAVPASAAALSFSAAGLPNPTGSNQINNGNVSKVYVAPNGNIFVIDSVNQAIMKSTDGGFTFKKATLPTGFVPATDLLGALAISPSYVTDSTVFVVATIVGTGVVTLRSIDAGATFVQYGGPISGVATMVGTSIDLDPTYNNGVGTILVGTSDTATGAYGSVYIWGYNGALTWYQVGSPLILGAAVLTEDVTSVKFSPYYPFDFTIFAVGTSAASTQIHAIITPAGTWDPAGPYPGWPVVLNAANEMDANVVTTADIISTSLAFPADFNSTGGFTRNLYVGTNSGLPNGPGSNRVFRINNATATALDPEGLIAANANAKVWSLAYSGTYAAGTLYVGLVAPNTTIAGGTTILYSSTNANAAVGVTFTPGGNGATGPAMGAVALSGTDIYLGTSGAASPDESAFNVSTDSGANYRQRGLIDTAIASISDLDVISSTEWYMITSSGGAANEGLWYTTNGGTQYIRMLSRAIPSTTAGLALSQNFANDKTMYFYETGVTGTPLLLLSNDAGMTWLPRPTPTAVNPVTEGIGDLIAVDQFTLYIGQTGTAGHVYKSVNNGWTYSTMSATATGSTGVNQMKLDPVSGALLVGSINGRVYISTNGTSFTQKGASPFVAGATLTVVALDSDFSNNGVIYAASTVVAGTYRMVSTTTGAAFVRIDAAAGTPAVALPGDLLSAPDGVLYASDTTGALAAAGGIVRTLIPTSGATGTVAPAQQRVTAGLTASVATLTKLQYASGSNFVIAISTVGAGAIFIYEDTLNTPYPAVVAPGASAIVGAAAINVVIEPVTGATGYQVQWNTREDWLGVGGVEAIQTAPFYSEILGGGGVVAPVPAANPPAGATIYYRVQVTAPVFGPWSPTMTVQTQIAGALAPNSPAIVPPATPEGSTAQGGFNVDPTASFFWGPIIGATTYEFQLASDAGMTNLLVDATGADALGNVQSYTVSSPLDYSTAYYWRVRALSATSETSWSNVQAFRVMDEPAATATSTGTPGTTITITTQPAATITFTQPQATNTTITLPSAPATTEVGPAYIWAIIIIGAVLVIAVIVLIVRTRRSV